MNSTSMLLALIEVCYVLNSHCKLNNMFVCMQMKLQQLSCCYVFKVNAHFTGFLCTKETLLHVRNKILNVF